MHCALFILQRVQYLYLIIARALHQVFAMRLVKLHHIGKQVLKFNFELHLCDVRGLPEGVSAVSIHWERGGHVVRSRVVATSVRERLAMLDVKLRSTATLYRSAKRAAFDAKPSMIKVIDETSGSTHSPTSVLGVAEFDLAEHANLDTSAPPKVMQLPIHGKSNMLLQFSLISLWLESPESAYGWSQPDITDNSSVGSNDKSDHGSDTSSSMASAALTHEALLAFEAQHAAAEGGLNKTVAKSGKRWTPVVGRDVKLSTQMAELYQLLGAAEADATLADELLTSLLHRLRAEVLAGSYKVLEQAPGVKNLVEQSKLYKQQLAIVVDQVAP